MSQRKQVSVQPGDTMQALAVKYLGDASRWRELAEFNGLTWPYLDFSGLNWRPASQPASGRVLGQGDFLTIPAADDPGVSVDPIGSDWRPDGTPGLIGGQANLRNRLLRRLMTPVGYLPPHPTYGTRLYELLGGVLDAPTLMAARVEIAACLKADPGVLSVDSVKVWADLSKGAVWFDASVQTVLGALQLSDWASGEWIYPVWPSDGEGLSISRRTIEFDAWSGHGFIDPGRTFLLLSVNSSAKGRFRLYSSADAQAADATRKASTPAKAGSGCISDIVFDTVGLQRLAPLGSGSIYPGESCVWAWDGPASHLVLSFIVLEE